MTVQWVVVVVIALTGCGTQALQSSAAGQPDAVAPPTSGVRSVADIPTAYGLSVVSADDDGRHLQVQIDDESCRRTTLLGVVETPADVTLHVAVRPPGAEELCDLVEGGTVFDVEVCEPVWGRRLELSGKPPPPKGHGCR